MGCDPKCPDLTVTLVYSSFLFSLFLFFSLFSEMLCKSERDCLASPTPDSKGRSRKLKLKLRSQPREELEKKPTSLDP